MTGLWTAYELCRADPSLEVVVLEREQVGYGASGRNGGWAMGELSGNRELWVKVGGEEAARRQRDLAAASVDEIARVVSTESIECDFERCGFLEVAQSATQLSRLRRRFEETPGPRDATELLDAAQTRAKIAVADAAGSIFQPDAARVHPGKLVIGLAMAAERSGVTIYENSEVSTIGSGAAATESGSVKARWIVQATEAFTSQFAGRRRAVVPISSAALVTEPLDQGRWDEIGWTEPDLLTDSSHMYVYLQRTADRRILIGGRGVPYRFGSRITSDRAVPARTVAHLRSRLVRLFPSLATVRTETAWQGVLGASRDWAPSIGVDRETGLAWAYGYGGEGVAATNLAGRTLRDLVLGRSTELTALPWVGRPSRQWEPEPLRFLGIHAVYALLRGADREERLFHRPSKLARAADLLTRI